VDVFLQARQNPKMTTKSEQKKCIQRLQIACNFGNSENSMRFFDTNRAQLSQGKLAQAKPSRAESPGINRPPLYTLTPDRPPLAACTGINHNL